MDRPDVTSPTGSLDPSDMLGQIRAFCPRVAAGLELQPDPPLADGWTPRRIVVCGMGGSAVAGDIVRALLGDGLGAGLEVSRSYSLPPACDSDTLAFFCSYSGNTEETLSACAAGRRARVQAVCITSGGRLAELAAEDGLPLVTVPGGNPPRASFGYALGAILEILARADVIDSLKDSIVEALANLESRHARWGPDAGLRANEAAALARQLTGRVPVLYGSAGRLQLIAARWAAQIAENGKQLAYSSELPEMNHNEIVGWRHPAAALESLQPVFLLDGDDHPAVTLRAKVTMELMASAGAAPVRVRTEGSSWTERLLALTLLGDYVSYYLALANAEDPTPVAAIDTLKRRLAEPTP